MFSVKSNFNKENFLKKVSDCIDNVVLNDTGVGDNISIRFEISKKQSQGKTLIHMQENISTYRDLNEEFVKAE